MKTITDQGIVNKIKKVKTSRGKRVLRRREPQLVEDVKRAVLCRCSTANQRGVQLLKDLHSLKKPNSTLLNRKESWQPFTDASSLEFVAKKNDCSLFAYVSHSKKRPNNLILGRTYDAHILDMVEFAFDDYQSLSEFRGTKITTGNKPIILFSGEQFDSSADYQRIKSLLLDFFLGPNVEQINLNGLEHVIHFVQVDDVIYMRSYGICLKKSGVRQPRVELEEIGPNVSLTLRRVNLASLDLFKKALKQPDQVLRQQGKKRKPEEKNIGRDAFGSKVGRIHMERQDYSQLRLRKGGAYKAKLK